MEELDSCKTFWTLFNGEFWSPKIWTAIWFFDSTLASTYPSASVKNFQPRCLIIGHISSSISKPGSRRTSKGMACVCSKILQTKEQGNIRGYLSNSIDSYNLACTFSMMELIEKVRTVQSWWTQCNIFLKNLKWPHFWIGPFNQSKWTRLVVFWLLNL